MANQWTNNPSNTYAAHHMRMRKLRGKATQFKCFWCIISPAAEWSQFHGCDGSDPYLHFVPSCRKCHRSYDGTPAAVAKSNRNRTGEKRRQYVVKDPVAYRAMQTAKVNKRWGNGGDAK